MPASRVYEQETVGQGFGIGLGPVYILAEAQAKQQSTHLFRNCLVQTSVQPTNTRRNGALALKSFGSAGHDPQLLHPRP